MDTPANTLSIDVQPPAFTFMSRIANPAFMEPNGTKLTPSSINPSDSSYQSPYQLSFNYSWSQLTQGLNADYQTEGNAKFFQSISDWFSPEIYINNDNNSQVGSLCWGPAPCLYQPPTPPSGITNVAEWQAQRLLTVTALMIGYNYMHHHIPDWNPSQAWYTYIDTASSTITNPTNCNSTPSTQLIGQGLDCSDYTSWLYNYGLGIYLNTDVADQGAMVSGANLNETATIQDNAGNSYTVTRIADASMSYEQLTQTLQTGDLLYIAGGASSQSEVQNALAAFKEEGTPLPSSVAITHVILWVGNIGISSNNVPLITDSHGNEVLDSNNVTIPGGIQVRPFNNNGTGDSNAESSPNWYYAHFLWALRVLPTI